MQQKTIRIDRKRVNKRRSIEHREIQSTQYCLKRVRLFPDSLDAKTHYGAYLKYQQL